MCESNAYLILNGQELMIMESVDIIEPIGKNEWYLVSMFGERKTVKARFKSMQLIDHRVLFEAQTGLELSKVKKPFSKLVIKK